MPIIKSISYDQSEIIKGILDLHVSQGFIDCDPTFSKGNFYKNTGINEPKLKFDLYPQTEDTIKANACQLPLRDNSLNCLMFDPPFLATKGKSLTIDDSSNKINKRFGVYPTEPELHRFYINALKEFYRVLKPNGVLIFKCQDKVSSGIQYMSHVFVINEAMQLGYYTKDMFILLAKNRIVANWQAENQKNSRKYHSYFLVLEKSNKKVKYTNEA